MSKSCAPLFECANCLLLAKGLMDKILVMEKKYDEQFKIVFQAIYRLMEEEEKPKRQIGFQTGKD